MYNSKSYKADSYIYIVQILERESHMYNSRG
jgi:hypothetical protein